MRLTAGQLNRATLGRQMLLARQRIEVVDAVRAVCALQAQSAASVYIALWSRIARFDPRDLDRAFAEQQVVKATLMRITLHAVAADDYPVFQRAMVDDMRRSWMGDPRFTDAGLTVADADALVPELLAYAQQARSNGEMEAWIAERASVSGRAVWWGIRRTTPVIHSPTGGPWSFGDRPSYVAAGTQPVDSARPEALALLIRRYLAAFGAASEADISQFTLIPRPPIRAALDVLGDELLRLEGPDRKPLLDVPDGLLPSEEIPAPPRLLGMWDNVLLAYRDRSRVIPEAYRKAVIRSNGDVLPTVLVDGHVAGVWRPAPGQARAIEITAFHPLDDATWAGLESEARSLVAFLADRQPDVYSRYARWWASLQGAEIRTLV